MRYLGYLIVIFIMFSGCGGGGSDSDTSENIPKIDTQTDIPQPSVKNTDLQPPKPPAF